MFFLCEAHDVMMWKTWLRDTQKDDIQTKHIFTKLAKGLRHKKRFMEKHAIWQVIYI